MLPIISGAAREAKSGYLAAGNGLVHLIVLPAFAIGEEEAGRHIFCRGALLAEGTFRKVFTAYHYLLEGKELVQQEDDVWAEVEEDPSTVRRYNPIDLVRGGYAIARELPPHAHLAVPFHTLEATIGDALTLVALERKIPRTLSDAQLTMAQTVAALSQAITAIAFLHRHRVLHQDIKEDNLLLKIDGEGRVTLLVADFTFACRLKEGDTRSKLRIRGGSQLYQAPEVHRGELFDHKIDVWAWGIVSYRSLLKALSPKGSASYRDLIYPAPVQQLMKTFQFPANPNPIVYPTNLPELAHPTLTATQRALTIDPDNRPTSQDLAGTLKG